MMRGTGLGLVMGLAVLGCGVTAPSERLAAEPERSDGGYAVCVGHGDCPPDQACEYWFAGCAAKGECRPPLRAMDAHHSCFGVCGCDGRWYGNVYGDFAYQRIDWQHGAPCEPLDLDGGAWPDPVFATPSASCSELGGRDR